MSWNTSDEKFEQFHWTVKTELLSIVEEMLLTRPETKTPNSVIKELHCSDPTCGGEEQYTQTDFFVQTILADRYIHPREM